VLRPKDEFTHRLNVFRKEVEASKKKFKICKVVTKESTARVMQGKDYSQDAKLELWKV